MSDALVIGGYPFEPAGWPVEMPSLSLTRREDSSAGRSSRQPKAHHVPVTRRFIPEQLFSRLRGYFTHAPAPLGLYIDYYA